MKAVVLEIRDGVAAVLREDGLIEKVNRVCKVGDTIEISEVQNPKKRIASKALVSSLVAAAAAVVAAVGGTGAYNFYNNEAYAYVSLDVNPSIEYTLNRVDKVIDVNAVKDDAQEIVDAIRTSGYKGTSLEDALRLTENVLKEKGYLSDDENYVLVNISTDDEATFTRLEALTGEVFGKATDEVTDALSSENEPVSINVDIEHSSKDDREKARDLGISTGRFEEIKKIEAQGLEKPENDIDVDVDRDTVEKYEEHSVKDLFESSGRIKPQEQNEPEPEQGGSPVNENNGVNKENKDNSTIDDKEDEGARPESEKANKNQPGNNTNNKPDAMTVQPGIHGGNAGNGGAQPEARDVKTID